MVRKVLIDTDTASDDAVALMMALQTADFDVLAITIVCGNVPVEQGSLNARYTVELCAKATPVYNGASRPLMRDPFYAHFFHGPDGMGGMNYPAPKNPPAVGHAVDVLIDTIQANPGIMLVTLGPMTNIALAVSKAPEIAKNVSRCVVMGGAACTVGNVTPAAEYNIWFDPEAARICFRSGLAIEMVGWELCRGEANLLEADMRYCREVINTPMSHFAIDCKKSAIEANRQLLDDPALPLPDPVAMAIAIDPTMCTRSSRHYVEVECEGIYTRGMTVVDQMNVAPKDMESVRMWEPLVSRGGPNALVCWEIDIPRWKELLYSTMRV
jgi:purine nucleosidase